eukprot:GFUD01067022.1.p1 GENE.GFUD01067022.1~~GFUD01067022.1.p1  ORF type:complete len:119 (+),score=8.74 GFUD01067022.1:67-423(+)
MLLLHLVCLAIACGIACSCKCAKHWPGDDCLCEGSEGRVCYLGCGDCDDDSDCKGDLVCGMDNCREMHPNGWREYDITDDCCYSRTNTELNKNLDIQASCAPDAPWSPKIGCGLYGCK